MKYYKSVWNLIKTRVAQFRHSYHAYAHGKPLYDDEYVIEVLQLLKVSLVKLNNEYSVLVYDEKSNHYNSYSIEQVIDLVTKYKCDYEKWKEDNE
jgi:hypothetical protein